MHWQPYSPSRPALPIIAINGLFLERSWHSAAIRADEIDKHLRAIGSCASASIPQQGKQRASSSGVHRILTLHYTGRMLERRSRALSLSEVQGVHEFNYDQHCLIDAQRDHQAVFTSVLSAYNVAKITNCIDPDTLDRILTVSRDTFKARDEAIRTNRVPEI
jgi:hypothetical protein